MLYHDTALGSISSAVIPTSPEDWLTCIGPIHGTDHISILPLVDCTPPSACGSSRPPTLRLPDGEYLHFTSGTTVTKHCRLAGPIVDIWLLPCASGIISCPIGLDADTLVVAVASLPQCQAPPHRLESFDDTGRKPDIFRVAARKSPSLIASCPVAIVPTSFIVDVRYHNLLGLEPILAR